MRRVPVPAGPPPPARARLFLVVVAGTLGLWLLAGARASAAPVISGADGDVWNAASPVPTYVITSDAPNRRITWSVAGVASGAGRSPLQVRLSGIGDGQYRLVASGQGPEAGDTERAFRVDLAPGRVATGMARENSASVSAASAGRQLV